MCGLREGRRSAGGQIVTGIILVAIGAVFLLERLDVMYVDLDVSRYWPFILIAIGLAKMADSGAGRRRSGAWLIMVGGILLLHTMDVLHLHDSWPLFIVAAGIATLWKAIELQRHPGTTTVEPEERR
jgi:hypothetical protein